MGMLFITNRFPVEGIKSVPGRKFTFDLENNAPSNSVYFCERTSKGKYTEIGSEELLRRLKTAKYRQVLAYIHGFSNLPEDVFESAAEFQRLADEAKKLEVLVLPIIWPCDGDCGVIKDYWDDQHAADASDASFARLLQKFIDWRNANELNSVHDVCLKRINVLAHSMGNRVLRETLASWNRYYLPDGVPLIFRNAFLVAPDIVNESLEKGWDGELICHASRNVVVYYAADDLALRASKAANLKNRIASRRLGHTGPENMDAVPSNVYSIDCDEVNNDYDYPKGHSYFRSDPDTGKAGVVFNHIFETLLTGRIQLPDPAWRSLVLQK